MNEVEFNAEVGSLDELGYLIEEATIALRTAGLRKATLSVMVASETTIRALNSKWRGKETTTDVLSFPQYEPGCLPAEGAVLGDVVICLEVARRQAQERKHDLSDEMRILLIHGICHLLGHSHEASKDTHAMRELENKLLRVMTAESSGAFHGLVHLTNGSTHG